MGRKYIIALSCILLAVVGITCGSLFDIAPDPNQILPDNNGIGFDASVAGSKHVGFGDDHPPQQSPVIQFQTTLPTTPAPRVVYVQQPVFNHPPPPPPIRGPPRRPCKRDAGENPTATAGQQPDPNAIPQGTVIVPDINQSDDNDDDDSKSDSDRGTNQIDQAAEDFKKFLNDNKINLTKKDEDLLEQFKEQQKTKLLTQQKQARGAPEANGTPNATAAAEADRTARGILNQQQIPGQPPVVNQTGTPDRVARSPVDVMGQPMMGQPMMGQPMMGQPMMGQPSQPMMGQPMGQPMMGGMMGQPGMGMGRMRGAEGQQAPNATHEQHARNVPEENSNNATAAEANRNARSLESQQQQQQQIPGQLPTVNQTETPDRVARIPAMMGQPMMGGGMMGQQMGGGMGGQPMMGGGGMMGQPMMGHGSGMHMRAVEDQQQAPNATHEQHARNAPEQPANATHQQQARNIPEVAINATHQLQARNAPEQPANVTHELHARNVPDEAANATQDIHARNAPEQPANATHEQQARSIPDPVQVPALNHTPGEVGRNARQLPSPMHHQQQMPGQMPQMNQPLPMMNQPPPMMNQQPPMMMGQPMMAQPANEEPMKRAISPKFGGGMVERVMNYFQ